MVYCDHSCFESTRHLAVTPTKIPTDAFDDLPALFTRKEPIYLSAITPTVPNRT
jgi:hypothetical protein